jgi:hypothetical protein
MKRADADNKRIRHIFATLRELGLYDNKSATEIIDDILDRIYNLEREVSAGMGNGEQSRSTPEYQNISIGGEDFYLVPVE